MNYKLEINDKFRNDLWDRLFNQIYWQLYWQSYNQMLNQFNWQMKNKLWRPLDTKLSEDLRNKLNEI